MVTTRILSTRTHFTFSVEQDGQVLWSRDVSVAQPVNELTAQALIDGFNDMLRFEAGVGGIDEPHEQISELKD